MELLFVYFFAFAALLAVHIHADTDALRAKIQEKFEEATSVNGIGYSIDGGPMRYLTSSCAFGSQRLNVGDECNDSAGLLVAPEKCCGQGKKKMAREILRVMGEITLFLLFDRRNDLLAWYFWSKPKVHVRCIV